MSATRAKFTFCVLVAIWGYAFWPTLHGILQIYSGSGYDYQGFMIVPLILTAIWYKRSAMHRVAICCSLSGLFLLLLFAALWLLATITRLQLLEQFSLISMLISIIVMIFGRKISGVLIVPLLSLFLLLPIGKNFYFEVQQFFSWLLVKSLTLTDLAVYWEKNHIHVGTKTYIISDILKSFQYVMLYLTFGIAFAFVQAKKWYQGIIISANFIIIPFALCFVTLFCIISINRWFDFKILSAEDFIKLSWILTSFGLIAAVIIGFKLGGNYGKKSAFNDIDWRSNSFSSNVRWFVIIVAVTIILAVPILAQNLKNNPHYSKSSSLVTEPGKISNWTGPVVVKHSTANAKVFEYNKNRKSTVLSLVDNNNSNRHDLYDVKKWHMIKETTLEITLNKNKIPVTETVLKNNNQSKIIWSVHYVNGHLTNSQELRQVLEKLYTLSKHGAETGTIAVSTDINTELGAGRILLKEFLLDLEHTKNTAWLGQQNP